MTSHTSSPAPPQRLFNVLVGVLSVALLLLLAWQLAGWTWHFLAPSRAALAAPTAATTNLDAARTLFGAAPPTSARPTPSATTGVRLKGVYAIDGKTLSAAVVNRGAKNDIALRVGDEIQPGMTLASVHPDHIIISKAGVRERVDLELRSATPLPQPGAPAAAGFRLNVSSAGSNSFSLSRNELNTVLQDPRQMNFLGRIGVHPNGGVRIEQAPSGSLAGKLGMKEGDIIRNVNGQPVNSPGDLARVYQQFGALTQIRAEVVRAGAPMMLTYQIQQ